MTAHHPSGPSKWYMRAACEGSAQMEAGLPDSESAAAWEGTCAHAVLERCINEFEFDASIFLDLPMEAKGKTFTVTRKMVAGVNVALSWFSGLLSGKPEGEFVWMAERELDLSCFEPGMIGTADLSVLHLPARHLYVGDYKNGFTPTPGALKWQARGYARGALELFDCKIETVTVAIIQPNDFENGPIKEETFHALDLYDFTEEAREMLAKTKVPNAPRTPGDHCRFCKGANTLKCPEFADGAVAACRNKFDLIEPPSNMDSVELGRRLKELTWIKLYCTKLEALANAEAFKGNLPKGFNWYWGRGTRKWRGSDDDVVHRGAEIGHDLTDIVVTSVAQAEKRIGKKVFAEKFADLIETSRSPKLEREEAGKTPITLDELHSRNRADAFSLITAHSATEPEN